MSRLFVFATAIAALTACGGVSDNTSLSDITEEDAEKLCEEFVKDYPARTITCEVDGMSFEVGFGFEDTAECTEGFEPAPEGCAATVGDVRDCFGAQNDVTEEEVCDMENQPETPASCEAVFDCYM